MTLLRSIHRTAAARTTILIASHVFISSTLGIHSHLHLASRWPVVWRGRTGTRRVTVSSFVSEENTSADSWRWPGLHADFANGWDVPLLQKALEDPRCNMAGNEMSVDMSHSRTLPLMFPSALSTIARISRRTQTRQLRRTADFRRVRCRKNFLSTMVWPFPVCRGATCSVSPKYELFVDLSLFSSFPRELWSKADLLPASQQCDSAQSVESPRCSRTDGCSQSQTVQNTQLDRLDASRLLCWLSRLAGGAKCHPDFRPQSHDR